MKKLSLFLASVLVLLACNVHSQYITPGNSLSLTLDGLVGLSGGVVSYSNGEYLINNTLTISATDTLRILQAAVVRVASGIRLEVKGTIISDPAEGFVMFTAADTTTSATNFKGFRFEDSPANLFRNTEVSFGGGIQLISSQAMFENCVFRKNGSSNVSAVITYSSCSPVISGCYFIENARSAIGSGANVQGSPQILNNFIYHNTTDNSNRPQINLGPGAADTILIVGNYIEGYYTMAGGIGISNLVGVGNTKVLVKQNYILGNRYGYAQIGNNIMGVIEENELIDNNIQDIPAQGGSGLNFQASGAGNTAIVRQNRIKGNLWGITIQGTAQPSFGTESAYGQNVIYENGNSGQIYDLYNNTALDINAIGNYWGTNDPTEAENHIFHQPDQSTLGLVSFTPLMEIHPVIESFVFLADENPGLTSDCVGLIDQAQKMIHVVVPATANLESLIPQITLPRETTSNPQSGVPANFTEPVTVNVQTPHGESAEYVVTVEVEIESFTVSFIVVDPNGNAVNDAVLYFDGVQLPAGVYVVENVMPGNYPYEIHHPQFATAFGTVLVENANVEVMVQLQALTYSLTFVVSAPGGPIEGATVQLQDFPVQTTDANGQTIFQNLPPGIYGYNISKELFEPVQGSIEIVNQNVTVNVVLESLTGLTKNETCGLVLIPNPANDFVRIDGNPAQRLEVTILTVDGKKLIHQPFEAGQKRQLDLGQLKKGIYQVVIKGEKGSVLRLVKQ